MRQKRARPDSPALDQEVHVPSQFVDALAIEQDAGSNFYGQAIYPVAKRARRCQARSCKLFVQCFQGSCPRLRCHCRLCARPVLDSVLLQTRCQHHLSLQFRRTCWDTLGHH